MDDEEGTVRTVKRRRMCEISLDQLRMFGENGKELGSRNDAATVTSGVLTHEDKIKKSIRASRT